MMRVRTTWTGGRGTPFLSTHYFGGVENLVNADAAALSIFNLWEAIRGSIVNDYTYTVEGAVALIDPATGAPTGEFTTSTRTNVCVVATDQVPLRIQGLIRWRTTDFTGGRRLQGRTYIPGMDENANVDGQLAAGQVALLTAQGAAVINNAATDFGVWRRPRPGLAGAFVTAVNVVVPTQWSSLQRRAE